MSYKKDVKAWFLWPIILALGFVPMIIHAHAYDSGFSAFDWYPQQQDLETDFFLYYKMCAIIMIAMIMMAILCYVYFCDKKQLYWNNIYDCLIVYGVCVLFSAIFSPYRSFAFKGSFELFESAWAVLSYLIICIYTSQLVKTEKDIRYVAGFSCIGIVLVTTIGFFQFLGLDFFRTTIGKMLITTRDMWGQLDNIAFTFPLNTSYTTLYNTNYLAFYYGLLIPILLILLLLDRNNKRKIIYAILFVASLITLIGSNSKSALLALGITILLGCVILHRYLNSHKWIVATVVVGMVAIVTLYAYRVGGLQNLYSAIFNGVESHEDEYQIKDIDTLDDEVVFRLSDHELHISYEVYDDGNVEINLFDENGEEVTCHMDDLTLVLDDDEAYASCRIHPMYYNDMPGLMVTMDGQDWFFTNQIDNTYYYLNGVGKYCKISDVEKAEFFPDSLMSGRGKLWNYLLPKLKSCLVFGTGANTFPMVYPNDNYVIKKYEGTEVLFDVKAHNMYLQQFCENGLIALLALLAFYIWYFIQSFKLYFGLKEYTYSSIIGIGILLGSFDYMIIAVANDSNVNTAPVFWVLIGIGLAVNNSLKKQLQDEKASKVKNLD